MRISPKLGTKVNFCVHFVISVVIFKLKNMLGTALFAARLISCRLHFSQSYFYIIDKFINKWIGILVILTIIDKILFSMEFVEIKLSKNDKAKINEKKIDYLIKNIFFNIHIFLKKSSIFFKNIFLFLFLFIFIHFYGGH